MPRAFQHHEHWYDANLRSVSHTAEMIYTYSTAIHGFATRLTAAEAESLATRPGILSVLPEQRYELHTTRTPEFLGLGDNSALLPEADVVVGVLDTGIWPERKSYSHADMGDVPSWWKGECEAGANFSTANCNPKLIGARFLAKGYEAAVGPIDWSNEHILVLRHLAHTFLLHSMGPRSMNIAPCDK
ncbi:hypothetical protein CRG98_042124 [Punica granatum]|uniref:Inhibitor I9 domain-containing protein n=1 Tax=Punica granatum TaxID=22663 RepID=A0A2I0I0I5_PUNGR|nr:hypothetical protein CRG98_042124 [Punica granatum]